MTPEEPDIKALKSGLKSLKHVLGPLLKSFDSKEYDADRIVEIIKDTHI
jgi:hypothetical protein